MHVVTLRFGCECVQFGCVPQSPCVGLYFFFYCCLCNTTIEFARVRCGEETARRKRLFTLTALAVAEPTGGEVLYKTRTKLTVASLIRLREGQHELAFGKTLGKTGSLVSLHLKTCSVSNVDYQWSSAMTSYWIPGFSYIHSHLSEIVVSFFIPPSVFSCGFNGWLTDELLLLSEQKGCWSDFDCSCRLEISRRKSEISDLNFRKISCSSPSLLIITHVGGKSLISVLSTWW